MKKRLLMYAVMLAVLSAAAYLPPVAERNGIKVEIGSFPQNLECKTPPHSDLPLGVTEVDAGAPRPFPVTLWNGTAKSVAGTLSVWMNDDWDVVGPQGRVSLAAGETKTLMFTGTAKPRAIDALYPVHATFTPDGADPKSAVHPIAIFRYRNPNGTRIDVPVRKPQHLGAGVHSLDRDFTRRTFISVGGNTVEIGSDGVTKEWGGRMRKDEMSVGGVWKHGYTSHPPYWKGAGFIWSDFPLELPDMKPIVVRVSNFLVSSGDKNPSDGVEYRIFVEADGKPPKEVAQQIVKEPLVWKEMSADISEYAGRKVTLRLWTGPGPQMNTVCDGGGWGDPRLEIDATTEKEWAVREKTAVTAAMQALRNGDGKNRYLLKTADGTRYGASVIFGERGLADGVIAFTDGTRSIAYRGFTARVETAGGGMPPQPKADVRAEKGTLRIAWSLPGVVRDAQGFPRLTDLAIGPATVRPVRVYAGFGNVVEDPKSFFLSALAPMLSTRHVGADYANGLSVVQAVDVPPDGVVCDGERNLYALHAHHDATFTFVPSAKGAFEAARRFRAVSGYRKSPGHDALGSRMCLDQWSGDYAKAAADLRLAAKYGITDAIFVKHDWQAWGFDYRLPEIYPPHGDFAAFMEMRKACDETGILFCLHDNYTDLYPDSDGYSYGNVVFNLDGTPQLAWYNRGRRARAYRFAPHAFGPWCERNARLLHEGCNPNAVFIDVLTAHTPFDYLDRDGRFHTKAETSRHWGDAFRTYRERFGRQETVCVSEGGADHLVGVADAGQSDHFPASKWLGGTERFGDAERTPWHDIVTHNRYVLFAGGLGDRYEEERWHAGGDTALHGYGSDDYLSNTIIGGRNPMSGGPFSRTAVKTYWMQHDACADLGAAEFLDLRYEDDNIHRQHSFFSDGGEVWVNRQTNATWTLPNGIVLPPYGYFAKTPNTESGIVLRDGQRCGYVKGASTDFFDARKPSTLLANAAISRAVRAETVGRNHIRVMVEWETRQATDGFNPFVHVCRANGALDGIAFQCGLDIAPQMFATPGKYMAAMDVRVPDSIEAGTYEIRYGAWQPRNRTSGSGGRMSIGGAPRDKRKRVHGGDIVVEKEGGKVVRVAWRPVAEKGDAAARARLLGENVDGTPVQFAGVRTDGSFRLMRPVVRKRGLSGLFGGKRPGEWRIVPLPHSAAFTAELDLAALGAEGAQVAAIESVDAETGAAAPRWSQDGAALRIACDAKAFAYRIRWAE